MDHFVVLEVVAEFAGKWGCQVIRSFFFDSDSPENLHVWSVFLDLDQLVDGVCGCELDSGFCGPDEIFFVFDRIGVDNVIKGNTSTETCLYFLF